MSAKKYIISAVTAAALAVAVPVVEKLEGVEYKPYKDIAGIPTVCAGITGTDVIMGKTYTAQECRELLGKHMLVATKAVDNAVTVEIPVGMRAAMYSFTFNAGQGAFKNSTMLKLINQGKFEQACDQLHRWVYYKDPKTKKRKVSPGLKNRRAEEYQYCMMGVKGHEKK